MNQSFIDAIMHFMSLVFLPLSGRKYDNLNILLREYVDKAGIEIDADECLKIFNSYTKKYREHFIYSEKQSSEQEENLHKQILADAGQNAQQNLYLKERFLIILALLEFTELNFKGNHYIQEEISRLAENLNLGKNDFDDAYDFISKNFNTLNRNLLILEEDQHLEDMLEGSWIEEYNLETQLQENKSIFKRLRGRLTFRYFSRFNFLTFYHEGKEKLTINKKPVYPGYFYSLDKNDIICFDELYPIHYEEIIRHFKLSGNAPKIELKAINLEFSYTDSEKSVKPFSVIEESGKLLGIIGNNGVGKSTILKLISGHLRPTKGKVFINNTELNENHSRMQSVIGFVSHNDFIFPELSIYENLLFQARLSLGNLSETQIRERVGEVIRKFSLQDILDEKIKEFSIHNITEYERKCVNIAFEMLRNPLILCLDEPLTGLSYYDAKRLMSLLKEEVYSGKLVIMTVHLPTLEIFKIFDKILLIDYDGHMIYSGEPKDTYSYLDNTGLIPYHLRDKNPDEVSPEEIINLIETRKIGTEGRISNDRLISPEDWYKVFRKETENEAEIKSPGKPGKVAPVSVAGIPGIEKQFLIYLFRNFRKLINDWRYVLIYLIGIPAIGITLASIIRHVSGVPYTAGNNIYLPLYFFFIVNYMLFSGLLTAADAIYRERRNSFRDYHINLSPFSYFNAKIFFMFLLSLVQVVIIVLLGNSILEIRGLFFEYSIILFSVSSFAILLSLNLSSAVRNLSSVYLMIPFILIPNLVYTGYLIQYDDYRKFRSDDKEIPLVAEFIPARLGYEAIVVSQFKNNKYNRYFFETDLLGYQSRFNLEKTLPLLEQTLKEAMDISEKDSIKTLKNKLDIINHEFRLLGEYEDVAPYEDINYLNINNFDADIYESALGYITYLKFKTENTLEETENAHNQYIFNIRDSLKSENIIDFKNRNHNSTIEKMVKGHNPEDSARIEKKQILKSGSMIYMKPESNWGRAVFFSASKRFNNRQVDTISFNLSAIWALCIILYLLLINDFTRVIFNLFRKHKLVK